MLHSELESPRLWVRENQENSTGRHATKSSHSEILFFEIHPKETVV